jgi:hypothetical protein
MRLGFYGQSRPRVAWSRNCPRCRRGTIAVRTGASYTRFWYCAADGCGWACWRPPAGIDCPSCGAGLVWSHSRLSVGCPGCGLRVAVPRPEEGEC